MKKTVSILLAVIIAISTIPSSTYATSTDSVGLTAVISTDKEQYAKGEKIVSSVSITNAASGVFSDINMTVEVPNGFQIDLGSDYVEKIERLSSGETASFGFTLTESRKNDASGEHPSSGERLLDFLKKLFKVVCDFVCYIFTGHKTDDFDFTKPLDLNDKSEMKASKTVKMEDKDVLITVNITYTEETASGQSDKVLIAYFSATGNTKGIAEHISNVINADLYEIVSAVPYTSADLNYNNSSSRANIEMNDPNARPAISGTVENMEDYDVIFLGYPIWWGQAPRIINTFLESYDFSGKTIIPFCTSGSSGIGSSATNLHSMASDATWLSGRRFASSASEATVAAWINGLDLNITTK